MREPLPLASSLELELDDVQQRILTAHLPCISPASSRPTGVALSYSSTQRSCSIGITLHSRCRFSSTCAHSGRMALPDAVRLPILTPFGVHISTGYSYGAAHSSIRSHSIGATLHVSPACSHSSGVALSSGSSQCSRSHGDIYIDFAASQWRTHALPERTDLLELSVILSYLLPGLLANV